MPRSTRTPPDPAPSPKGPGGQGTSAPGRPARARAEGEASTPEGVEELSFQQARTALELTLAELQAGDLDVEVMGSLYQRAMAYADRCEALLAAVEQEVMQWDPEQPEQAPVPYSP